MTSLADIILQEDIASLRLALRYTNEVNAIDEYGYTPLIEAAIVDHFKISELLLKHGANPNQQDVTGGTALHWAVENNHLALGKMLLKHGANPNAYNFSGQPILVMPILRQQNQLKQLLLKAGASLLFAQDFINTKLLGHLFELVGITNILDTNHEFVEVDFEGFFLEVTLGLISDSLIHFQNHFAARQLRRYFGLSQFIVEIMQRALELVKYQQYRVDINKHSKRIDELIKQEPILIPVGYEGHAITFIKQGDIWIKCDRREDSRLYDNIMFYRITQQKIPTNQLIRLLMFEKQTHEFINETLDQLLGLEPITELKVDAQISGNCSWANVEAAIPALFFLVLMRNQNDAQAIAYYKTLALNYFHRFREWSKDRALQLCITSYKESNSIRKACKAEILATILFQRCKGDNLEDKNRIDSILSVLANSPYEYLLKNYLKIYYYESNTEEGKQFAELLKEYGVI